LLGATFKITPWEVATSSYYCFILAIVALLIIAFYKTKEA
jgi:hypothetical protein